MELTGSAVTALFVGLVWTLIKVVEFFVSKHKKTPSNVISAEQAKLLSHIDTCDMCSKYIKSSMMKQEGILREILENTKDLYEMHNVYNEDHVPAWYVSPDLIRLARENKLQFVEAIKKISEVEIDQDVIVGKMSELITSQRLMTERLGDLISALNKNR